MNEKSVSKQQQKFFGIVRGLQTGKIKDASPEAKKAAATMSKKDVKDFAATKHKGLPKMKESLPSKDEACWDTHKQVGMKKKGGKMVPNCVPEKVEEKVNEAIPLAAPLVGLAARGAAKAAGRYLAKKATKAVAKKVAKRVAVGAAGAVGRAAVGAAIPAAAAAYTAKKAKDKLGNKEKKENVSSADKKPEIYIKPDGKRGVRMVKVDKEIIKKEGYIGAKGEKGRDYHNAGKFDKDTAYSHAKTHNGVVHKDSSGKYLVKHGRGKNVSEGWRSGGGGYRDPFKAARRDAKYKELSHEYEDEKKLARLKQLQRQKAKPKEEVKKKDISVSDYKKKTGKKTVSLKHLTKNTHIDPFKEETVNHKTFTTIISELTDKQRAEIAKRKAANQAKRGARRGPSKGTKSSEGDWTADQQKSAKPLSFEINKNDKHDAVHKTLAKAADASHPSLGGRKVTVKINGKSKEMAHKDLQHAVDLHKRLPLPKKKAVMDLIRDKGHEGVAAAANHFRKTYK